MIPSYPKNRSKVTLPTRHNPGRGRPQEYLAYMTPDEMEMLRRITDGRVEIGPNGIPSFADDSASSKGVSRGDSSGTKGSGSSPSGSGTKSNTSSGGSYGGGGKMGSSSTQSGGTKSSNSNPSGSRQNGGGPGGGMMGGSLSGGSSRTSPSSGSGAGTGGKNNSSPMGAGRDSIRGLGQGAGGAAIGKSSSGSGGNQGTTNGAGRDSVRGLGVGAGTTAIGRSPPGSAGLGNNNGSRSVVNNAMNENTNRPKNPSGPFGAPGYNGQYNPNTGKYGIDDGGQTVNRTGKGDMGQVVNGIAKADMEQSVNRLGKADYGGYTTQAFGKTDMQQHVNRVDKADIGQTVNRVGKADIAQTVNRADMGDLGGPVKGDLPSGVSYTAAAPSGVFGPRAQPPGTSYLNDLSHIGNPPNLAGPLQANANPNPYARVNDEAQTIGFRSDKADLQRPSDVFDGPASKRPVSTAAAPPPTVTRETARAPKTRGLDPYNVTPALGGRLVDNQKFSDYDPSSPRANMQATLENNRQRVNTVEKTDLPARPSTYGGYSFNQSSALQAAAVDSGLVGSIDASYGIDPSPVRPAAPQAVNAFKAQAVPDEALPGSHLTPAADEGPLEVDIPGYPSAPKYSFPDYSVYNNWDATKAGLIASKAIRDAQAENILDVENYYDPASDGPISGPDVPPSEAPSQEGWWEGDVPPSQREPLVDKSGWPNRVFNGASRLLDNFVPGAGWGMRKMKDASIDRINQMSPAEQALMKERWDRERDAYVRGDIGPGRGGNRSSPLASLLGSNNGYIPPGASPMPDTGSGTDSPAPPGATPPDPWKRRRVGNPADPYTYGYGPAYNYFTYGS